MTIGDALQRGSEVDRERRIGANSVLQHLSQARDSSLGRIERHLLLLELRDLSYYVTAFPESLVEVTDRS